VHEALRSSRCLKTTHLEKLVSLLSFKKCDTLNKNFFVIQQTALKRLPYLLTVDIALFNVISK